jgi:hypothetical protein
VAGRVVGSTCTVKVTPWSFLETVVPSEGEEMVMEESLVEEGVDGVGVGVTPPPCGSVQ